MVEGEGKGEGWAEKGEGCFEAPARAFMLNGGGGATPYSEATLPSFGGATKRAVAPYLEAEGGGAPNRPAASPCGGEGAPKRVAAVGG